jgi:hypothetical protein
MHLSTLFLGFLNKGDWARFDEFNRIEIEVLIIIRIQLITIFNDLPTKK